MTEDTQSSDLRLSIEHLEPPERRAEDVVPLPPGAALCLRNLLEAAAASRDEWHRLPGHPLSIRFLLGEGLRRSISFEIRDAAQPHPVRRFRYHLQPNSLSCWTEDEIEHPVLSSHRDLPRCPEQIARSIANALREQPELVQLLQTRSPTRYTETGPASLIDTRTPGPVSYAFSDIIRSLTTPWFGGKHFTGSRWTRYFFAFLGSLTFFTSEALVQAPALTEWIADTVDPTGANPQDYEFLSDRLMYPFLALPLAMIVPAITTWIDHQHGPVRLFSRRFSTTLFRQHPPRLAQYRRMERLVTRKLTFAPHVLAVALLPATADGQHELTIAPEQAPSVDIAYVRAQEYVNTFFKRIRNAFMFTINRDDLLRVWPSYGYSFAEVLPDLCRQDSGYDDYDIGRRMTIVHETASMNLSPPVYNGIEVGLRDRDASGFRIADVCESFENTNNPISAPIGDAIIEVIAREALAAGQWSLIESGESYTNLLQGATPWRARAFSREDSELLLHTSWSDTDTTVGANWQRAYLHDLDTADLENMQIRLFAHGANNQDIPFRYFLTLPAESRDLGSVSPVGRNVAGLGESGQESAVIWVEPRTDAFFDRPWYLVTERALPDVPAAIRFDKNVERLGMVSSNRNFGHASE